jgi:hypothetical protein
MTEEPDRFDEFVQREARGYHVPPATPRDGMWSAIAAERRARSRALAQQRRRWRWAAGIAAVLALGVALGRLTAPGPSGAPATVAAADPDDGVIYRAAASEYLGRAEALLLMFRSDARGGRRDEASSQDASRLLSTNRLLLDSPAAADPEMRRLLEDLELVMAQIAQLSAERGTDPTDLILHALEENSVLLRLRAAIPAPLSPMTAEGAL